MTTLSRQAAQTRADQIRVFQRELETLQHEGVVTLDPAQRQGIHDYHQSLLAIQLAYVLACDRELVSYGLAAEKIQAVCLDIGEAFLLVPSDHRLIVVTIKLKRKSGGCWF